MAQQKRGLKMHNSGQAFRVAGEQKQSELTAREIVAGALRLMASAPIGSERYNVFTDHKEWLLAEGRVPRDQMQVSPDGSVYCPVCDRLHMANPNTDLKCLAAIRDYDANLHDPSARIRIGIKRFNYELQRSETLLEEGWVPVVPPDLTGEGTYYDVGIDPAYPCGPTHEAEQAREILALRAERDAWKKIYEDKHAENKDLRAMLQPMTNREGELLAEIARIKNQLWLPTEPGDHPYHGPTAKDPETGRNVPVSDAVHERYHGAIGDVLAGRVIPEARRQMQEALKKAPKEPTVIPTDGPKDDHRHMGWRV